MAKLETDAPKLEDSINQQVFIECQEGMDVLGFMICLGKER